MEERRTIGLIVAMDKELELFMKQFKPTEMIDIAGVRFYLVENFTAEYDVVIAKSGIGKVNAAICATLMMQIYEPFIVISTGVCGSLDKHSANQGDIYLTSIVKYHDVWCGHPNVYGQVQDEPVTYPCLRYIDSEFIRAMSEKFSTGGRHVWWGPTLSGDYFVDTKAKAIEILKYSPNGDKEASIDMETGAIAQVCSKFDKKFVSIRIISDAILNPEVKKYDEFWNEAGDILNSVILYMFKHIDKISVRQ